MTGLVAWIVALGIPIAGLGLWFLNWLATHVADKGIEKFYKKYFQDPVDDEQISADSLRTLRDLSFISRFAGPEPDFRNVLALRRAFFRSKVIVPDGAYRVCRNRNPHTMKVVYDADSIAVGYWSIIPVSRASFAEFTLGKLSHKQMLVERCIAWDSVNPEECYLYIVGAVVPFQGVRGSGDMHSSISRRVLLDAFAYMLCLFEHVKIKGVCGYPTKKGGHGILEKIQLEETSVLIDGDREQPIFKLDDSNIHLMKESLKSYLDECPTQIPKWVDRGNFLDQIPRTQTVNSSSSAARVA